MTLWPVLRHPHRTILMDIGDPVLNASILHWNATTTPLTRPWWNFPAYAPVEGVTAFTEHLLALYPLASPLIWATGNPVTAYNVVCLLLFPLTAAAMFALGRALTGSTLGATAAAIALTFSPYRVSHLSHIQMLATFGMPLALLGLHEYVDRGVRRGLALFAAGWLFTAGSNGYLMAFFGLYVLFWTAWFCSTPATIRRVPAIAAAGALASLPLVPVLLGYIDVHARYDLQRSVEEIQSFGADVTGIARPWPNLPFASALLEPQVGEGALFPGVIIVALAVVALSYRRTPPSSAVASPRSRWAARATLTIAAVFLAAAAVGLVTDVRFTLVGVRISISDAGKPLTVGMAALLIWLFAFGRSRAVFASRSRVAFYALMVPVAWLFSLGPTMRVHGAEVAADLPYTWLLGVPGLTGLRVPARFWILGVLSLAVLAGFGAARLSRGGRTAIVWIAVALMLVEAWPRVVAAPVDPFPTVVPPPRVPAPVLELPLDRVDANTVAALRAVTGGYTTINGYSGYEPPHFGVLRAGLAARDVTVVTELRRRTAVYVSVAADDRDGFRSWLTGGHRDARLVGESPDRVMFHLDALPADAEPPAREIPFAPLGAACGHALLRDMADESVMTRWECGVSQPGYSVTLELAAMSTVTGIVNMLGPYVTDAPRQLRIDVSPDGRTWAPAWEGPTAAAALRAAFEDPSRLPVTVRFPPARGRYVRLTQTGPPTGFYWSIAELRILGR